MQEQKKFDKCFKKVPVKGRKVYQLPEPVKKLLEEAQNLSPEEFEILCLELVKTRKLSKEQIAKVKNLLISEDKRAKEESAAGPSSRKGTDGSGQPSTADPGPSNPARGLLPLPATKVPLIVRTDLAAIADVVTLDTEKIINNLHQPKSGDVAVVDLKGRILYWAYIYRPMETVCRLNTSQTGLTTEKLKMGISIEMMHSTLLLVLRGKTVAGMKIQDDLDHLGLSSAMIGSSNITVCELQNFFVDEAGQPIKLAQLAVHFIGSDPQEGAHSSVRDARITAICYKRMTEFKSIGMATFRCEEFDAFRREARRLPKPKQKWEPCRCGLTKKQKPKKNRSVPQVRLISFDDADLSDFD